MSSFFRAARLTKMIQIKIPSLPCQPMKIAAFLAVDRNSLRCGNAMQMLRKTQLSELTDINFF